MGALTVIKLHFTGRKNPHLVDMAVHLIVSAVQHCVEAVFQGFIVLAVCACRQQVGKIEVAVYHTVTFGGVPVD